MIPAPLRIPAFRAYWLARLASTIAQMSMVIVIGWQVYDIARRTMDIGDAAFQLGLIGLAQFVPLFVLTPVSGWAADHFDRRHITRAALGLELLCALDPVRGHLERRHRPADPVRGRRPARRRPRVRRARVRGARAQPRAAQAAPERNRAELDRLAGGRDRRPGARRHPLRHHAPPLLRSQQRAVRLRHAVPVPDRPGAAHRDRARPAAPADGRGPALHPPQPTGAGRDHARPVRGAAGRGDGDAADLRPRHPRGRGAGPRPASGGAGARARP